MIVDASAGRSATSTSSDAGADPVRAGLVERLAATLPGLRICTRSSGEVALRTQNPGPGISRSHLETSALASPRRPPPPPRLGPISKNPHTDPPPPPVCAAHAAVTATALERAWNVPRTPTELILASTSRYRRELLERLGFAFRCVAPDVDETAVKRLGLAPRDLALELAKRKAGIGAKANPAACVIGSDQVCSLGSRIFSKPMDRAGAIAQLEALSGQTHELSTAVAMASGNELETHVEVTTLRMRELSRAEIERFVDLDTPFDCAGSYKIEAHGIGLFAAIQSTDWNAIVGLPLLWLGQRLRERGFAGP